MNYRPSTEFADIKPLLKLIEQRFGISLSEDSELLRDINRHYREKREFILAEHGESGALKREDYAKAVMLSEASKLMILREIMPKPKKNKSK